MFQTFCLIYSIIHDFPLHSLLGRMQVNCDAVPTPQYNKNYFCFRQNGVQSVRVFVGYDVCYRALVLN